MGARRQILSSRGVGSVWGRPARIAAGLRDWLVVGVIAAWVGGELAWGQKPVRGRGLASLLEPGEFSSVPLSNPGGYLQIPVQLSDTTRSFLLDTGWSVTSVDRNIAVGFKTLGELGVVLHDSVLGRLTQTSLVVIPKMQVGDVVFQNLAAQVGGLVISKRLKHPGVLGCDFLLRSSAVIDCARRELFLRRFPPPLSFQEDFVQSMRGLGYEPVALTPTSALVMTCMVDINGKAAKLVVDTGASATFLSRTGAERLELSLDRKKQVMRGVGSIGSSYLQNAMVAQFQMGGHSLTNVNFGVAGLERWGLGDTNRLADVDGLLGLDLLQRFGAVIQLSARTLWVRPPLPARPPPISNRGGKARVAPKLPQAPAAAVPDPGRELLPEPIL